MLLPAVCKSSHGDIHNKWEILGQRLWESNVYKTYALVNLLFPIGFFFIFIFF